MRRFWGRSAGLLIVVALGTWFGLKIHPREPTCGGRSLSFWLDQLSPPPKTGPYSWSATPNEEGNRAGQIQRAQIAIHSIGAQGVPFLLDRVRREHSLGERFYGATWHRIPRLLQRRLPAPRQFRTYGNPHRQVVCALQTLDSDAVPALIAALKDFNSDVRITALAALGGFGADADPAVSSLIKLAGDSNGFVRRWAIWTIGRLGPARTNAIETLVGALKDTDTSPLPGSSARVRETAAEVLGQLGPQARIASPELRKLLTDANSGVRQEAAIALWRISGDRSVLPILIEELRQRDNDKKLIEVLGDMGPIARPAIPAIKDALGPSWLRAVRLRPAGITRPAANSAAPAASTLEEVAGEALCKIDPGITSESTDTAFVQVSPLKVNGRESGYAMMGGNPEAWAVLTRDAAPALVQVLNDPNPEMRIEALLTLGRVGWKPDREAVPKLTSLLSDRGAFRYRGWEDQDLGREFVCIGDLAAEMLGHGGADARSALTPLKELLADSYWSSRPYGPLAIWRIGKDTNVLQYIIPRLQDAGTVPAYRRFLNVAAELGEAAKPAVPAILRGMTNFTEDLAGPVHGALVKIDPATAGKLSLRAQVQTPSQLP